MSDEQDVVKLEPRAHTRNASDDSYSTTTKIGELIMLTKETTSRLTRCLVACNIYISAGGNTPGA
jgi:hypothetical protein